MVLLVVVKFMLVLLIELFRKFFGGFIIRIIWLKICWSSCNVGSVRGILFFIRVCLYIIVFSDLMYDFKLMWSICVWIFGGRFEIFKVLKRVNVIFVNF